MERRTKFSNTFPLCGEMLKMTLEIFYAKLFILLKVTVFKSAILENGEGTSSTYVSLDR